jgi:heme a synthase
MVRREAPSRASGGPRGVDPTRGLRRLAIATTLGTLLLIAMGGAVRATDSGLACPDWPACYGKWIPPADVNMWFEHSHRLWAGVIGIAVAWLTVWTLLRFRHRPALWGLSVAASVLVLVQAGLGAAVVLLHLRAGLVTSHLGMSLVVVGCLIVLAVLARPDAGPPHPGARRVGRWAAGVGGLVFLQALLGGQATGRGAAHVFNAVPIWLAPDAWTGHAREWLHVTHRAGGYLVALAVVVFALAVRRLRRADPTLPAWTGWLPWLAVGLVVVQVALGLTNVLTRATVWSAIGHLTVASWLWASFVLAAARGLLDPASSVPATDSPSSSPITEEINA